MSLAEKEPGWAFYKPGAVLYWAHLVRFVGEQAFPYSGDYSAERYFLHNLFLLALGHNKQGAAVDLRGECHPL